MSIVRHPLWKELKAISWEKLWKYFEETGEPLNEETSRLLLALRGYQDPEFFANYYFGEKWEFAFSQMHYDFFEAAKNPERRGVQEVIAAPRCHAKTTFKLVIKAVHAIAYELETFILLLGHSKADAEDNVGKILNALENNERLKAVFGNLLPNRKKGAYRSRKQFVTASGIIVMGRSKEQSLRGLNYLGERPSLIILDDVESLEETRNPEQRKKTRDWFFKDIMNLGRLRGQTNITMIGTCLHPDSLLSELLVTSGWERYKYQAVISYATRHDLWEEYKRLLIDLGDPYRAQTAYAFYKENEEAMLEGAEVLWPEGDPYEFLMRKRIEQGVAAFNSEKQNDPFDPEWQILNMEEAKWCRLVYEGSQLAAIHWIDKSGAVVKVVHHYEIERIIAYHDPALGKEPTQHSRDRDFAAVVVVAQDRDGYLYVLDAYIERDLPDRQVQRVFQLFEKWGFDTLYFENNGSQALMEQIYRNAKERLSIQLPLKVIGFHQTENKYERISTLQPEIVNGYLRFAQDLPLRFLEQLRQFPTGHDDGPDALHGAVRQFQRGRGGIVHFHPGQGVFQ